MSGYATRAYQNHVDEIRTDDRDNAAAAAFNHALFEKICFVQHSFEMILHPRPDIQCQ